MSTAVNHNPQPNRHSDPRRAGLRSRRAARRSTPRSATSGCARTATTNTRKSPASFAHYNEDPYVEPGFTAPRAARRDRRGHHRRRLRRPAGGGAAARGRGRPTSASSRRPATSAAPGTGTAIPARSATSSPTSTCRCSRRPATCRRRSTPSRRRSSSTASASASTSTSTSRPASRPQVSAARWDEDAGRWTVTTDRGDDVRGPVRDHVERAAATRPKLPGIPGIDDFKGHTFHTSRWDYDYTGGDTNGGLTSWPTSASAIIGTGATAIQCVPHLGAARQAALRLPAHAVVGGRARQQAHRPGVGGDAQARLAATSGIDNFSSHSSPGSPRRGGPGGRRAGPSLFKKLVELLGDAEAEPLRRGARRR